MPAEESIEYTKVPVPNGMMMGIPIRDKNWTKIPINPNADGTAASRRRRGISLKAKIDDPSTFASLKEIPRCTWIGFAGTDFPYIGRLDADDCRDPFTSEVTAKGKEWLARYGHTFTTISSFGRGFSFWFTCKGVPYWNKPVEYGPQGETLELFCNRPKRFQIIPLPEQVINDVPFADFSNIVRGLLNKERVAKRDPERIAPGDGQDHTLTDIDPTIVDRLLTRDPSGGALTLELRINDFSFAQIVTAFEELATEAKRISLGSEGGDLSPHELAILAVTRHLQRTGRAIIPVVEGRYMEAVDQCVDAMLDLEVDLYSYNGVLIRPTILEIENDDGGVSYVPGAEQLGDKENWGLLSRNLYCTRWEKGKKKDDKPRKVICNLPDKVAEQFGIEARDKVRPIVRITCQRMLDRDGRFIEKEGYDAGTKSLLMYLPKCSEWRLEILRRGATLAEGKDALDRFTANVLPDYPFIGASRAVAICYHMNPLLKNLFSQDPLGGITAPGPGHGKTQLLNSVAILMTGFDCPMFTWEDDEIRDAIMLETAIGMMVPVIGFDNAPSKIQNRTLAAAKTGSMHISRTMHTKKGVKLDTRNSSIFFTANKLEFIDTLERRGLQCTLDARRADPWKRQFTHMDLSGKLRRERGDNGLDLLIAAQAFILAKKRGDQQVKQIDLEPGSYHGFDGMTRSVVVMYGDDDPNDTVTDIQSASSDVKNHRDFLLAWWDAWGEEQKVDDAAFDVLDSDVEIMSTELRALRDVSMRVASWEGKLAHWMWRSKLKFYADQPQIVKRLLVKEQSLKEQMDQLIEGEEIELEEEYEEIELVMKTIGKTGNRPRYFVTTSQRAVELEKVADEKRAKRGKRREYWKGQKELELGKGWWKAHHKKNGQQ